MSARRAGARQRSFSWEDPAAPAAAGAEACRASSTCGRSSTARCRRRRSPSCSAFESSRPSAGGRCSRSSPPSGCTTRSARSTAASRRRCSTPAWAARCTRRSTAGVGYTTTDLQVRYIRAMRDRRGARARRGARRARRAPHGHGRGPSVRRGRRRRCCSRTPAPAARSCAEGCRALGARCAPAGSARATRLAGPRARAAGRAACARRGRAGANLPMAITAEVTRCGGRRLSGRAIRRPGVADIAPPARGVGKLAPLRPTLAAAGCRRRVSVLFTVVRHGPLRLSELAELEGLNPTMLSRVDRRSSPSAGLIRRARRPRRPARRARRRDRGRAAPARARIHARAHRRARRRTLGELDRGDSAGARRRRCRCSRRSPSALAEAGAR